MTAETFLNPLYQGGNPLRDIAPRANAIEKDTGIAVVRCHVGDPTGPTNPNSIHVMIKDLKLRATAAPHGTGYAPAWGSDRVRQQLADATTMLNRLPEGSISKDNIVGVTGGTGALNVALSTIGSEEKPAIVLAPEPYYPAWKPISRKNGRHFETFSLRPEDDFLLNEEIIEARIQKIKEEYPGHPIILLYHYPHNPTGKTLTEQEAETVGGTLNNILHKHSEVFALQEDLYLATTRSDMAIYNPLPYLSDEAKDRTLWLHSPSKEGHPQDRGSFIGAFNTKIAMHISQCASLHNLGGSENALLGTANTIMDMARSGLEARGAPSSLPSNHRFKTADYYQARMKPIGDAIAKIEEAFGSVMLHGGTPKGTYYIYPYFNCLKGQSIPEALLPIFKGCTTFENGADVALALENAHLLGLRPVTSAPGTLFEHNPEVMSVRFAAVARNIEDMKDVGNTILGLVEKTLGRDLGATYRTVDEMRSQHVPPSHIEQSPLWTWEDGELFANPDPRRQVTDVRRVQLLVRPDSIGLLGE